MNRFIYLLALLSALYGIVTAIMSAQEGLRRPREIASVPPPPRAGPNDPVIKIEVGTKGSSTGTAFAITDNGWWLTARHVAHGCDAIWIQTGPRKGLRVQEIDDKGRDGQAGDGAEGAYSVKISFRIISHEFARAMR